ncbi:MAG: ABC transporter permease, partial [Actinomycetia bacterium]|nr:ABC transporter permease [Actinomycetes bacterium]
QVAQFTAELGLDKPAWRQYLTWLGGLLQGDLGNSFEHRRPVTEILANRLPVTFELAFFSISVALAIGPLTGMISAIRRGKPSDGFLRVVSVLGLSVPNFLVGVLMITYLSLWFNYAAPFPYQDIWENPWNNFQQMRLPAIALGLSVGAATSRMTRSSMLEVLGTDYIRTVRAKGATEQLINTKHAFRNSLIPILTLVGLQFGALLGGTVILENMFSLPGLGSQVFESVGARDYPLIQAAAMVYGALFILVNILVDLAYGLVDPRIRTS